MPDHQHFQVQIAGASLQGRKCPSGLGECPRPDHHKLSWLVMCHTGVACIANEGPRHGLRMCMTHFCMSDCIKPQVVCCHSSKQTHAGWSFPCKFMCGLPCTVIMNKEAAHCGVQCAVQAIRTAQTFTALHGRSSKALVSVLNTRTRRALISLSAL